MKELKVISLYLFLIVNLFSGLHLEAKSIVSGDIVEGQAYQPNFLKQKGHFEKNANGTTAYADAAGTRPVDGSGGAPTLSCTRTTSSPIDGDGSLLITKDAANRQGQGCSIQFTIDSAYKAKVLQIEFDYLVASGTFTAGSSSSDSDLIVYIYDVTNSTLIEPSSIKLLSNSSTISDHFVANFQTSATGTTYNLILHQATTSSSAYTVKADNFEVKPSKYIYGTPITDWVSYTLTIGGSTSAPTVGTNTSRAIWRRAGDSMEIKYYLNQTGAGAAGSGTYLFPLPSGSTIDTNKATVTTNGSGLGGTALGAATAGNTTSAASNNATVGTVIAYNSTNLAVQLLATTIGQTILLGSSNYALSGATILYQFEASVPISGWSSSTQVSDGYDGRSVVLVVDKTAGTHTSTGSMQDVASWNTPRKDSTASFNATTGIFTAPSSGDYKVHGNLTFATNSTGIRVLRVILNSTTKYEISAVPTSTDVASLPFSVTVDGVKAGDSIKIQAYQSSGGNLNYGATTAQNTLSIEKLQAPTTISATEVVAASYTVDGGGQSLTSTAQLQFNTKVFDTHNAVTTGASWKFTAPYQGIYRLSYKMMQVNNTGSSCQIAMRKNASVIYRSQPAAIVNGPSTVVSNQMMQADSVLFSLNSGDYIDVYINSAAASGSVYTATSDSWINIERIK